MPGPRRQIRDAAVGAAIMLTVGVIALFSLFLDRLIRDVRPTYPLVIAFPEAAQVPPAAAVLLAGKPVGRARSFDFVSPALLPEIVFTAVVDVEEAHRELIRADSEARIARPLFGPAAINIVPGSPDEPVLQDWDTVWVPVALRPEAFALRLHELVESAEPLLESVRELDGMIRERRRRTEALAAEMAAAQQQAERLARAIRTGPATDAALRARLRETRATLGDLAERVRIRRRDVGDGPERVASRARAVIERLDELEALLDDPLGSGPRALEDPAVADAVGRIRAQLDSLITELATDPLRFLF